MIDDEMQVSLVVRTSPNSTTGASKVINDSHLKGRVLGINFTAADYYNLTMAHTRLPVAELKAV